MVVTGLMAKPAEGPAVGVPVSVILTPALAAALPIPGSPASRTPLLANAGLLAARIIAAGDPELQRRMVAYQEGMRDTVLQKAARLEEKGWRGYGKS